MTAQISAHGRIVADVTTRTTANRKEMAMARLAVNLPCNNADEGQATYWLGVVAFGKQAEALAKHSKGDMISVAGNMQLNQWAGQDGVKKEQAQVIADSVISAKTVRPGGRKATPQAPKPAEAVQTPQKPVKATAKSKRKMKKNAKHKHKQMLRLISIFPALLSEEEPKPFKVGILEDMAKYIADNQIRFGIGQVKSALARYTSNYRYQKVLAAGGYRYDLDGNPCGEVTPEQQAAAKEKTKAIKAVYNGLSITSKRL